MTTCPFSSCAINTPYDERSMRQKTSFLTNYSPKSYNQTSSYFTSGYPTNPYNMLSQYGMNSTLNTAYMNKHQHYEQKKNHYHNTQRDYWTQQMNTTELSMYDRPSATYYKTETIYPSETNFLGYNSTLLDAQRRLVYDIVTTVIDPVELDYTTVYWENIRPLPPKIRAIFMPSYYSPLWPMYAGPLRIPPFLYDGVSKPSSSLLSPPPLPMTTSFYTPNDLSQMIAQPYGYPTMAFSHNSNYQFPQTTLPMLNPQPYQPAVVPDRTSSYSTQSPSSFNTFNQTMQIPQYNTVNNSTSSYVYPPAQFASNSSTVPNYWTQPNTTSFAYAPLMHGRISPLLGRSTILQYASKPVKQQYSYPYYDEYSLSKTWSENLPPLPPGAIVVLDEYINANVSSERQHVSKKKPKRHQRAHKLTRRTITINPNETRIIQPITILSSSDSNKIQNNTTSQLTSLPSKTNICSDDLPPTVNSNHQTNLNEKKSSPTASQEELRDLRLAFAILDNPVDSLPAAYNSTANEKEYDQVDLVSLTTASKSEQTLSTINNL